MEVVMRQLRQGDILIERLDRLPDGLGTDDEPGDAAEARVIVLATGEATGHAHRLEAPVGSRYRPASAAAGETDPLLIGVAVLEAPATVCHDEHAPVTLPLSAPATPAQVLAALLAPAGLVWLVERLPTGLGLWLVARALDREPDPALRQEGAERLGPGRVLAALRRGPVAEDETGTLFALGPEPQPTLFVRVEDRVLGPEGLARLHWLPVPPHVVSPKEAVAGTFARPAAAYAPELET
jgi:hypothetical protein